MAEKKPLTIVDKVQGSSYLLIRSIFPAFQRRNLDILRYKIHVLRDEQSLLVLFCQLGERNENSPCPGGLWIRQGTDAALSPDTSRSYFPALDPSKSVDSLHGQSYLAIQAADGSFQQRLHADLERYKITVVREGDFLIVIFDDKDGKPGARGGSGTVPAFEARLSSKDLRVLASNFVR